MAGRPAANGSLGGFSVSEVRVAIDEQIRMVLRRAAATRRCTVELALQALHGSIPGVAFPEIVVHRDMHGNTIRLDVSFFDEIHDPSIHSVTVDVSERCTS